MGTDIDVLVIGAGVSGLTTAICVAEAGLRVHVRAARPPQQTTSVAASAMVGPLIYDRDDRRRTWGEATTRELVGPPGAPGVHLTRGLLAARPDGFLPPHADEIPGFDLCRPDELPSGFGTGFWATLPLVDMPVYLDYLVERLHTAGAEIEMASVESLAEAAALAPAVVNCSGLGARELAGDPDVRPVRGPKVVVENPGIDTFFMEAPIGPTWVAYLPHRDHVVLGGRASEYDENLEPDPAEEAEILRACAEIEPRLAGARVLEHRVGLRPGRAEVRLEPEMIDGSLCVHNYGHGGEGVVFSWGCARDVLTLLQR